MDTTYSQIISAQDYTSIMAEHIYMKTADSIVAQTALQWSSARQNRPTILDIGCGPGRITKLLVGHGSPIHGVDIDKTFLEYAESVAPEAGYTQANLLTYMHPEPVDIVTSHGLHHHIPPEYLTNVAKYIKSEGIYVLGDEFLPSYSNTFERQTRAIGWYSHVIVAAISAGHNVLAKEEAKTLLDDLFNGLHLQKSTKHIELVLEKAPAINELYSKEQWMEMDQATSSLLAEILDLNEDEPPSDLQFSRGDYKICHAEFTKQLLGTGFEIIDMQTVGPTNTIGGFRIYVLQKSL